MKTAELIARDEDVVTPTILREGSIVPTTFDEAERSVEVMMSTGAAVLRFDWWDGEYYDETLGLEPGEVRLDRMNDYAPLLDSHDHWSLESVIGSVMRGSVRIENGQMIGRVRFASTPDVADIMAKVRDGDIRKVSIGYQVHAFEWREPGEGARREMRAVDWEPIEVSFVALPAEFAAGVRSMPILPEKPGGQRTHAGGKPCVIRGPAAPTEKEKLMDNEQNARAADTAIVNDPPINANAPVVERAAEPKTAGVSAKRIKDICARSDVGDAFALKLIERNEDQPMTDATLSDAIADELTSKRAKPAIDATVGKTGTEGDGYREALETALYLRHNPRGKVDPKVKDAAREFRGMSLIELGRDYLNRTGIRTGGLNGPEIAAQALGLRYGAMTTSDFTTALSNVANKSLRDGYEAAPQTFRMWTRPITLPDFKPRTLVSLLDAPDLLLVGENGEFKRGAIGDVGDTIQLKTYGRIIAFTRQIIVNDDLGAFTRVPEMWGRAAADLESDAVYSILTGNPNTYDGLALFVAGHGNLAGAGTAITVASLGAARAAMRKQTGIGGRRINVTPMFLIVGPDKETEAQQVMTAIMADTTGSVNPFAGSMTLIVDPRITGNQWFLSADPGAIDTVFTATLEGQESVFLEDRVGFDVDGIERKARHDFAARAVDWRGLYKNPGA